MKKRKVVISARNLSKTFVTNQNNNSLISTIINGRNSKKIQALEGLNFEIRKGECFGVIGGNGSGKSTLLKLMMGSYRPDKDSILNIEGKLMRLSLGMGFDPNLTARENIYINGTLLGLSFKKIGKIFDEIISFTELSDFIDVPVRYYSKGMLSRLKFAIAVHAETDILLIDELFGGVGDLSFRKKSRQLFVKSFLTGKTIVFVSHSVNAIMKHCHRAMLLERGKQIVIGKPERVVRMYRRRLKGRKKKNAVNVEE